MIYCLFYNRLKDFSYIDSHTNKKSLQANTCKLFNLLVRPARFELAAYGFVVRRSIQAELRAHVKINNRSQFMVQSSGLWIRTK